MDDNATKVCHIVDRLTELASEADRDDLAVRARGVRARITDPSARVVVVGQLKQGKSNLINALLNVPVCRVGDAETTSTITLVEYAQQPRAELVIAERPGDVTGGERRQAVEMEDITRDLAQGLGGDTPGVLRLEIGVPSPLLQRGLVLVDTPGAGGIGTPYAAATLSLLTTSNAIIIVSDTSQEYTAPEMTFIRQAMALCPHTLCVASKIDLYPHWRQVVEADVAHLRQLGLSVTPLPTSSLLRTHAVTLNDRELNDESGFPKILEFLTEAVLPEAANVSQRFVTAEIRAVAEQLSVMIAPELAALSDPGAREQIIADLERAREQAKELNSRAALWQQTLSDGISDLTAESDYDLRARTRAILADFESRIEAGDPAKNWTQLGEELKESLGAAVGDNFIWMHQQSLEIADQVAESFAETGRAAIPYLELASIGREIAPLKGLSDIDHGPKGVGHKVITGLRGSYGGVMMFGMASTVVGMAMFNPFSLAFGALLGRKSYKEDAEMRLMRRQAEAKGAVRKLIDEVQFEVGRESRYRLRMTQRVMRDHFRSIAEQTTRSITESIKATEETARTEVAQREARAKKLEISMTFLNQVTDWAGSAA